MTTFNISKLRRTIPAMAMVCAAAMVTSCGGIKQENVTALVSAALEHDDYRTALTTALTLDDSTLMSSDSLMEMLAVAYRVISLQGVPDFAHNIIDMDLAPDASTIIFTDFYDATVSSFTYPDFEPSWRWQMDKGSHAMAISPDGNRIASSQVNSVVNVADRATGQLSNTFATSDGKIKSAIRDIAFLNNDTLITVGNNRTAAAWQASTGKKLWTAKIHSKNIKSLQIADDRTLGVTASNDGSVCVVKLTGDDAGEPLARFVHGDGYANDAAIASDNRTVFSAGGDGHVKIWDIATGELMRDYDIGEACCAIELSANGRRAAIGTLTRVWLLDIESGRFSLLIEQPGDHFACLRFNGNDELLVANDKSFYRFQLPRGRALIKAARHLDSTLQTQ